MDLPTRYRRWKLPLLGLVLAPLTLFVAEVPGADGRIDDSSKPRESRPNLPPKLASIVDAGSSGARFHIYNVLLRPGALPLISETVTVHGDCKLDQFVDSAPATCECLANLAREATGRLPAEHPEVSLWIKATGGIRALKAADRQQVQEALATCIEQEKSRFAAFAWQGFEVLEGADEAACAWLAVNDLLGRIGTPDTVGIFEVGGACFSGVYPSFLAERVFGLDPRRIVAIEEIAGQPTTWARGAMLIEADRHLRPGPPAR